MFRVEYFVDDKKLAASLVALVGIAASPPTVVPVVNVNAKGGTLTPKTNGASMERFAEELKEMKGKTITTKDCAPIMKKIGLAEASRTYMLAKAVKARMLRKQGKGTSTSYVVL